MSPEREGHRASDRKVLVERFRRVMLVVGVLLLLLDARLLAQSPVRGVPDNGDFWRVMHPAGIRHLEGGATRSRAFVESRFTTTESHLARHPSSPALIAWAARGLDFGALGSGVMDLRQMGIAQLLLLCGAFAMLAGTPTVLLSTGVLLLWVLSDPRYLLLFNSFYADAVALVGSFGIVSWLLRQSVAAKRSCSSSAVAAVALSFFTALVAFSKASYSPIGIVATLAVLGALRRTGAHRTRGARALLLALAAIAVLAPIYFRWGGGHRFPRINRYDSVYAGIAEVSKNPRAVLGALGVPRDRRRLVGTSSFDERVTEADRDTTRDIAPTSVALRYLEEPGAMFRAAVRAGHALARTHTSRPEHRASADAEGGGGSGREASRGGQGPPSLVPAWDAMRPCLLGGEWQVWTWIALGIGWTARAMARRRSDPLVMVAAYLVLVILTQIVVSVLGDGFFALGRHLLLARFSLDSLTIILLVALVRWATERALDAQSTTARPTPDDHAPS